MAFLLPLLPSFAPAPTVVTEYVTEYVAIAPGARDSVTRRRLDNHGRRAERGRRQVRSGFGDRDSTSANLGADPRTPRNSTPLEWVRLRYPAAVSSASDVQIDSPPAEALPGWPSVDLLEGVAQTGRILGDTLYALADANSRLLHRGCCATVLRLYEKESGALKREVELQPLLDAAFPQARALEEVARQRRAIDDMAIDDIQVLVGAPLREPYFSHSLDVGHLADGTKVAALQMNVDLSNDTLQISDCAPDERRWKSRRLRLSTCLVQCSERPSFD